MRSQIFNEIKQAIEQSEGGGRTAEMHLQMIKYASALSEVTGREFCEGVGLNPSFGTEFLKMKRLLPRLVAANLDVDLI